jgi:glycosyltransferase involved in cell wall biosynthesis
LNVTVVADPILTVPPRGYGGSERVVASLCGRLRDKGHRVTLVAARGSDDFGRLLGHQAPDNRSFASRAFRKLLFQPLSVVAARGADVVHNFGRVDYLWTLLRCRVPLVHTFTNPIADRELAILLRRPRSALTLVSVSDHQRRTFAGRGRWDTVYNAVNVERMTYSPRPDAQPYLAFLGRMTHNKGVHVAIDVARRAGLPLKIIGNISSERGGPEYFEDVVKPELGHGVEWVGDVVDDAQKAAFLGGARALLFPIQWDEPFAVVVGEALACGTPVIALRRASTPEAVQDGRTGFLCDSADQMVAAVARLDELRREDCRRFAETVLSAEVMTDRYLSIYQRTAEQQR